LDVKVVRGAYGAPDRVSICKNEYFIEGKFLEVLSADYRVRRGGNVTEYTCGFIGDSVQVPGEQKFVYSTRRF
jgi:hypothetical protein